MATTFKPGKLSHEPAVGHTPGSEKQPYTVVLLGNHPYMTNLLLAANKRGSLLARGGTYQVTAGANLTAPTAGAEVFWNNATGSLYVNPSGDVNGTYYHFGRVAAGTPVAGTGVSNYYTYEVEHDPNGEVVVKS